MGPPVRRCAAVEELGHLLGRGVVEGEGGGQGDPEDRLQGRTEVEGHQGVEAESDELGREVHLLGVLDVQRGREALQHGPADRRTALALRQGEQRAHVEAVVVPRAVADQSRVEGVVEQARRDVGVPVERARQPLHGRPGHQALQDAQGASGEKYRTPLRCSSRPRLSSSRADMPTLAHAPQLTARAGSPCRAR